MNQNSIAAKCVFSVFVLGLFLSALALTALAQSTDLNAPSPIRNRALLGKIAARDLGDSRLTDNYYAFTGTPGDLLITVQSRNLNGDIDVFTAGTLRPLLKITLYAESNTPVTKGIYLRRREDLILRVEARSPNDDEGTYQISFSGSFEPIVGGPDMAETETPGTDPSAGATGRRGKRVSSVGARIDEPTPPPTEVAAAPTPKPSPEATPIEAKKTTARPTTPQSARTRRGVSRTTTPTTKPKVTPTEETKPQNEAPGETEVAATPPKPKPTGRTNTRRSGTTARPVKTPPPTPAEAEPEVGPRLIIETNNGTLINRSMSTVRRVTVENGQVVVLGRDGKIDRILLVNVVRMTIQP